MEINGKIHASLKTRWLLPSNLLLHVDSPSWHSLAEGRLPPPAWPSLSHHQRLGHRQLDRDIRVWVGNTDLEKKPQLQVQPPVKHFSK